MSENGNGVELKEVDPQVLKRSVQSVPPDSWGGGQLLAFALATVADDLTPWGLNPWLRDKQLRDFWPTEPILAGTIYSLAIRDSAMTLTFDGPPRTVSAVQDLFNSANLGKGQLDFFTKLSIDLRTQDNGTFIELIRDIDPDKVSGLYERMGPEKFSNWASKQAVIGIAHKDSQRCRRTGNPYCPVVYTDIKGVQHKMYWPFIISLEELPSPIETMYGMQYCFVTRVLRAAQVLRDISIYKREKVGGRGPTDIHLVGGVAQSRIDDKLKIDSEKADNKGLMRYMDSMVVAGLDPTQSVSLVSIPLKSLPDGFDEDTTLKWYVAWLALNAGLDYQDLAPLPGGGLGTSQQSAILDRKSRGKGQAFIQKLVLQALNFHGVIPRNVTARYEEEDNAAALDEANLKKTRADYYSVYATSLGMSKQVVYQIMADEGDIDEEILQLLEQGDMTEDVTVSDAERYQAPEEMQPMPVDAIAPEALPVEVPPTLPIAKGLLSGIASITQAIISMVRRDTLQSETITNMRRAVKALENAPTPVLNVSVPEGKASNGMSKKDMTDAMKEALATLPKPTMPPVFVNVPEQKAYTVTKKVLRDEFGQMDTVVERHEVDK